MEGALPRLYQSTGRMMTISTECIGQLQDSLVSWPTRIYTTINNPDVSARSVSPCFRACIPTTISHTLLHMQAHKIFREADTIFLSQSLLHHQPAGQKSYQLTPALHSAKIVNVTKWTATGLARTTHRSYQHSLTRRLRYPAQSTSKAVYTGGQVRTEYNDCRNKSDKPSGLSTERHQKLPT